MTTRPDVIELTHDEFVAALECLRAAGRAGDDEAFRRWNVPLGRACGDWPDDARAEGVREVRALLVAELGVPYCVDPLPWAEPGTWPPAD